MTISRIPFSINIKDYLKFREVYSKLIQKIIPLGSMLDSETRELIESLNEFYLKFQDEVHSKIDVPKCFEAPSCLKNNCTSDINICKYVMVLRNNPNAIRVKNEDVRLFVQHGWKVESNDVRDDDTLLSPTHVVMVPEEEAYSEKKES